MDGTFCRWLFTTRSQPIRARQVFPCWDEPTLKTTFNISINHDPKYRLMSNMPIRHKHMENGTIWTYFDITPTMTTYHMAMAITMKDLYRISNIKKNINMWGRALVIPHLSFAHTVAETVMQDLVRYTGTLKIPKMDHLAIPEIQEEAIGNWGLNIYK
jgi:aminopeptidase N